MYDHIHECKMALVLIGLIVNVPVSRNEVGKAEIGDGADIAVDCEHQGLQ